MYVRILPVIVDPSSDPSSTPRGDEVHDGALPGRRRRFQGTCCAGLLAITLSGCSVDTSYVPRTPHILALGMKDNRPALYKDGVLTAIGDAPDAMRVCAPMAAAEVSEAANHQKAAKADVLIAGIFGALGVLAFPMFGVYAFFLAQSTDHEQQSSAHLIDAINRHNDAPECPR
jgi:hypothetical protein